MYIMHVMYDVNVLLIMVLIIQGWIQCEEEASRNGCVQGIEMHNIVVKVAKLLLTYMRVGSSQPNCCH